jgi:hypothetical protein
MQATSNASELGLHPAVVCRDVAAPQARPGGVHGRHCEE